jgi:hypothetical protein
MRVKWWQRAPVLGWAFNGELSRSRFTQTSNAVGCSQRWAAAVFDFHATTPFDFFPAMYFLIARRLFCLLRRCQFYRASCFMPILLVRRDKPASCLRMGVPLGRELTTHASLESPPVVLKFSYEVLRNMQAW